MTDLTPDDERPATIKFPRAFRGYATKAVDEYLEELVWRIEELGEQNAASEARAEELEGQLDAFRAREDAINRAMVSAQQLEVDAQVRMDHDAKLVHAEARREAQRVLDEVQRMAQNLKRGLKELATQKREFVKAFRTLLEKHMVDVETYEGDLAATSRTAAGAPTPPVDVAEPQSEAAPEPASEAAATPRAATNDDQVSAWLTSILGGDEPRATH